jgi:hypothetical protein
MIPNILFFLSSILFTVGQLGRIQVFYIYEIFYVLFIGYLVYLYKTKPLRKLSEYTFPILLFLGYMFISFGLSFRNFSWDQNLIGFAYLVRLSFYLCSFVYVIYHSVEAKQFRYVSFRNIIVMGLLIIVSSFVQYFLYPDLRNLYYLGWDPHLSRMFGTFLEPTILGAIFGVLIVLINTQYIFRKKVLLYSISAILLIGLVLTFSRGVYIAFMAVLFLYSIKKAPKLFLAAIALLILGV